MGSLRIHVQPIRAGCARFLCAAILVMFAQSAFRPELARSAEASYLAGHFDAAKEFPNYFLPEAYRNQPISKIPEGVLKHQQDLLNGALGSVFDRLVVPIVPDGESTVRNVRYFSYLSDSLRKVDPGMHLYASGGVVRAAISYLYDEIYRELEQNPKSDPSEILEKIAKSHDDVPAIRVRGIGSDFDLLVHSSSGKTTQLVELASKITNSASKDAGNIGASHPVHNTFFTLGDVRDYQTQIDRSTRQGGTVVDYLAYDIGEKKLKDPPRFPGLAKKLVSGTYEFAPPERGVAPEDLGDTVVRGARTLIEMPWLKLENEEYYKGQVRDLTSQIKNGNALSKRAQGQFAKGIRNSRYFGAHNRFYRGSGGSVEREILALASTLGDGQPSSHIPEFADSRRIDLRPEGHLELNGIPKSLLTPVDEFIAHHTDHGFLHHGTPSIENGLAILRQGLFLSKDGQGAAAYGRGAYSSPHRYISNSYAGSEGLVFDLEVRKDPKLNILEWQKVRDRPEIQKIVAEAKSRGRDPFELLSREHGIDIIVNGHVLIQNAHAVTFPGGIESIAKSLFNDLNDPSKFSLTRFKNYSRIRDYLKKTGESLAYEGADLALSENERFIKYATEMNRYIDAAPREVSYSYLSEIIETQAQLNKLIHERSENSQVQTLVKPQVATDQFLEKYVFSGHLRMKEESDHAALGISLLGKSVMSPLGKNPHQDFAIKLLSKIKDPTFRANAFGFGGYLWKVRSSDPAHRRRYPVIEAILDPANRGPEMDRVLAESFFYLYDFEERLEVLNSLPELSKAELIERIMRGAEYLIRVKGESGPLPIGVEKLHRLLSEATASSYAATDAQMKVFSKYGLKYGNETTAQMAIKNLKVAHSQGRAWASEVVKDCVTDIKIPTQFRKYIAGKFPEMNVKAQSCATLFLKAQLTKLRR